MEKFYELGGVRPESEAQPKRGRIRRWGLATAAALSLHASDPERDDFDLSAWQATSDVGDQIEERAGLVPLDDVPEKSDDELVINDQFAPITSPLPPRAPDRTPVPEQILEELSPAEAFANATEVVERSVMMGRHEVLVLDDGVVVGTVAMYNPTSGEPAVYIEGAGESAVRHLAGRFTDEMLLPDGVARSWVSQAVPAQLGPVAFTGIQSTTVAINNAVRNGSPELQELVRSTPDIAIVDVVHHRFSQPVASDDPRTRIQYISEELSFSKNVLPEIAQNEVRDLLLAVAAQESGGSDAAVSDMGAVGFWQFMPNTWVNQHNGDANKIADFREQVALVTKHFEQIHRELLAGISNDIYAAIRSLYPSDEAFYQDFWIKLMVNAFNAGGPRMAFGIEQFVKATTPAERIAMDNVFAYLVEFMAESTTGVLNGFQEYAMGYVPAVLGWQRALKAHEITLIQPIGH